MSSTHLTIYTTPPQRERKARDEIRRAGIKAYLPMEERSGRYGRRLHPLAPRYVIAHDKPFDAVYVRAAVGVIDKGELRQFQLTARLRRRTPTKPDNPFSIGQAVLIGEIPCTVAATDGPLCVIAWTMVGKQHLKPVHYSRLRPG